MLLYEHFTKNASTKFKKEKIVLTRNKTLPNDGLTQKKGKREE